MSSFRARVPAAMFRRPHSLIAIRQYQYIFHRAFLSRSWNVEVMRSYHLPLCWRHFFIGHGPSGIPKEIRLHKNGTHAK